MPGPLRSSEFPVIRPLKLRVVLTWVSLLVASIVFSMIGLEVSLRLIHHHDDYMIWPPNIEHTFQPSSEILPGVSGPAHFTTNADGFRGRPLSEHDTHRILAVGGSTTENLILTIMKHGRLFSKTLPPTMVQRGCGLGTQVAQAGIYDIMWFRCTIF